MNKSRLIITLSAILFLIAVIWGAYLLIRQRQIATPVTDSQPTNALPVLGPDPQADFDNFLRIQEERRAQAPQSERITVQGPGGNVSVKNFYKDSFFVLGTDRVTLEQGPGYTLSFDRSTQEFIILDYALSTEEYLTIRPRSEAALLTILDISASEACRLAISHLIPSSPEQASIEDSVFPFSGCTRAN